MQRPIPLTKDLVLVGGGHAHALLLKAWGMNPLPGVRLTLIDPRPEAAYTGMLPGFVAGHYDREEVSIDLVKLARFAGARLVLGKAEELHPLAGFVQVGGVGRIDYDLLSLNYGIGAEVPYIPGAEAHAVPVRPLAQFADGWQSWLSRAELGASVAILGAGLGGSELALAIAFRRPDVHVRLVDPFEPLSETSPRTKRAMFKELDTAHVEIFKAMPAEIRKDSVVMEDGSQIPAGLTITAPGARPLGWVEGSGLELHEGFVSVDEQLASTSHPNIFAAGDCAHLTYDPRPKAGVFAVRQAPILFKNLRANLGIGRPAAYRPQKDYLKLVSLGDQRAILDRSGWTLSGRWLWRRKDSIDRAFMKRLSDLPKMPPPEIPKEVAEGVRPLLKGPALCGACGSKVGESVLNSALASLPAPDRKDVISGPGDDAAVLQTGGKTQVLTTDTLRAFSGDHNLLARVTAVHALGDILAMGAEPQAVLANIVLPPLSLRLQERTLTAILTSASDIFARHGAAIVGGHTSEGSELSVGFSITGLCHRPPIGQAGAQAGDRIILTKPIGVGTILAAEMQGEAPGPVAAKAWNAMTQNQAEASRILERAHAMTDVTGFGLAGHLLKICAASGLVADLKTESIPFMDGAIALAERGIQSSLYGQNLVATEERIFGLTDRPEHKLLFDPQTSGGLLAAIPPEHATKALQRLRDSGYTAADIGTLSKGPPLVKLGA